MEKMMLVLLLAFPMLAQASSPSFYIQAPGFSFGYSQPSWYPVQPYPYAVVPRYPYPQQYNIVVPPRFEYHEYRQWQDRHDDYYEHGHHFGHRDRDWR